jgi:acetolactate synthase-1/2/3 large subunit
VKEADDFMRDLAEAKRPGILVGGGAYKARAAILRFSEKHAIPVFRTWNALDVVTDDSPVYGGTVGTYGGPGRNFGVQNCDLLLVLGCRLSGRITGGMPESFARGAKLYVVDVDPGLLDPAYQERKADVNVLCDAGEFVRALA